MAKILGYRPMNYSCFDPRTGLYDYWSDGMAGVPINGDLPVPSLPRATQIGVAAIEAGRKLPSGARHIGKGWQARGQIVQCGRNGFGSPDGLAGLSDAVSWVKDGGWKWVVGSVLVLGVGYHVWRK